MSPNTWNTATAEDIRRGAAIRTIREAYEIPRDRMAALMGVNAQYLGQIETGHRAASADLCTKFARSLAIPPASVLVEGCMDLGMPDRAA